MKIATEPLRLTLCSSCRGCTEQHLGIEQQLLDTWSRPTNDKKLEAE